MEIIGSNFGVWGFLLRSLAFFKISKLEAQLKKNGVPDRGIESGQSIRYRKEVWVSAVFTEISS